MGGDRFYICLFYENGYFEISILSNFTVFFGSQAVIFIRYWAETWLSYVFYINLSYKTFSVHINYKQNSAISIGCRQVIVQLWPHFWSHGHKILYVYLGEHKLSYGTSHWLQTSYWAAMASCLITWTYNIICLLGGT